MLGEGDRLAAVLVGRWRLRFEGGGKKRVEFRVSGCAGRPVVLVINNSFSAWVPRPGATVRESDDCIGRCAGRYDMAEACKRG